MHIHAVYAELCCARPRIFEPFKMLSTIVEPSGHTVRCTASERNWKWPDDGHDGIMIQQRFRQMRLFDQQHHLDNGWLIVAELDDHPDGLQGYAENDYIQLRAAHAVQVSTEPLAKVVRQYNPNVTVFENQIAELRPKRDVLSWDGLRIFYGAQNRQADWKPIMPALNRVLADHPDVKVYVIHDMEFYQALETNHKNYRAFCEYDKYRDVLSSCDIALLPLEPGPFNECKSDLKFLECAAEGVACLMSETAADQISPHPNDAYRMWFDIAHFEIGLRDLISNPDGRRQTAETAYAYVCDHRMLSQHFRSRYDWYQDLLGRKAELDRSLLDRVPRLAKMNEPSAC
jgi:hypothetical protein